MSTPATGSHRRRGATQSRGERPSAGPSRGLAALLAVGALACGTIAGPPRLEALIPRSSNVIVFIDPADMATDPTASRTVNWDGIAGEMRSLGLADETMGRVAIASLSSFEKGRGNLLVGRLDAAAGGLSPSLSAVTSPGPTIHGIEFHPTLRDGWFWARSAEGQWIAACDRVGCELTAPVLAGAEAPLVENPPEEAMARSLQSITDAGSFTCVWLPEAGTRDSMQASAEWIAHTASALQSFVPPQLFESLGLIRGMTVEGHGEAGVLKLYYRVAMRDPDAARTLAGNLQLLTGLANGLQGLAKSMGIQTPGMLPAPTLEVASENNLVLLKVTDVPRTAPSGTAPVTSAAQTMTAPEAQRRTMAAMRSIVTAVESYAVDNTFYPIAGGRFTTLEAIRSSLEPTYIRKLPLHDSWGSPYYYWSTELGSDYAIVSDGSDGREDHPRDAVIPDQSGISRHCTGATSDPRRDIVNLNGSFVQWPESTQS